MMLFWEQRRKKIQKNVVSRTDLLHIKSKLIILTKEKKWIAAAVLEVVSGVRKVAKLFFQKIQSDMLLRKELLPRSDGNRISDELRRPHGLSRGDSWAEHAFGQKHDDWRVVQDASKTPFSAREVELRIHCESKRKYRADLSSDSRKWKTSWPI
jgi:hypothetical protein